MVTASPVRVAAGIIKNNNTFLLGRRKITDAHPMQWEFPGGKVENGESPEEALRREFLEELNITVHSTKLLKILPFRYSDSKKEVELYFYLIESYSGELTNMVYHEIGFHDICELKNLDILEADRLFLDTREFLSVCC